jgi:GGDEF domain-containing protein
VFNLIEWLYLKQKGNLVYYDALTGVRSRQYYDMVVKQKYHDKEIMVAFVDVNDLKRTNDEQGHTAGSELLKRVAGDLLRISGENEVCRIGGDEFIVIGTFSKYALSVVSGISYGVYKKEKYEAVSSAVKKADESMYRHKSAFHHIKEKENSNVTVVKIISVKG